MSKWDFICFLRGVLSVYLRANVRGTLLVPIGIEIAIGIQSSVIAIPIAISNLMYFLCDLFVLCGLLYLVAAYSELPSRGVDALPGAGSGQQGGYLRIDIII